MKPIMDTIPDQLPMLLMAAKGREVEVMMAAGIPASAFNGKHQACFGCGGKDRLRWDQKRQLFFCGGGGGGRYLDWLDAVAHGFHADSRSSAIRWAKDYFGISNMDDQSRERLMEKSRRHEAWMAAMVELEQDNLHYDSMVRMDMDDLSCCIGDRTQRQMVGLAEISAAVDLVSLLHERYMTRIFSSSSFTTAAAWLDRNGCNRVDDASHEAREYSKDMQRLDNMGLGFHVFRVLVVRQMLIERKPDGFMREVLSVLEPNPTKRNSKPCHDVIPEGVMAVFRKGFEIAQRC